jgi:hypothetical protein
MGHVPSDCLSVFIPAGFSALVTRMACRCHGGGWGIPRLHGMNAPSLTGGFEPWLGAQASAQRRFDVLLRQSRGNKRREPGAFVF